MSQADARRARHRGGLRAETLAALWLRAKFYTILDRRYRIRGGEIDIVARRGRTIAFVEVKARASLEEAMISITEEKRRRISRAASKWLASNPWAADHALRGDAVYIAPRRLPLHMEAAMELDLG
ncbi:YraN family protein [Methylosinus sp. H3A]|uniref:YraN family protein n=1 Tax=Methylosinus sp. H3A TaxID=2785786 RepID=UPI0018C240CA|nr:YraN family protein [Methylosinus sp. H3A]MBG0812117.1 YraN family protein [Methylosinus sp. H3A]